MSGRSERRGRPRKATGRGRRGAGRTRKLLEQEPEFEIPQTPREIYKPTKEELS